MTRVAKSIAGLFLALVSCQSTADPVHDPARFYELEPYTVVVLPVVNLTTDVEAPRYFMSTIAYPLVNRGYYVITVQATAEILAAEGLGEGGALAEVAPQKFGEYFGADAVLYVTLKTWDTSYIVISSSVTVSMDYRLVSTRTGEELWATSGEQTVNSSSGNQDLISMLVSAVVNAAATDYVPLAAQANQIALSSLPPGPYHKDFEKARQEYLARQKAAAEKK